MFDLTKNEPVDLSNPELRPELLERLASLARDRAADQISISGERKYIVGSPVSHHELIQFQSSSQLGPWNTNNISFGGNYGIVAHAQLTIYSSGAYNFNGGFHNPDWVGYKVTFGWVIVDRSGTAFVFATNGSIAGAITKGSQDYNWVDSGTNPAIAAAWADLEPDADFRWTASINVDVGAVVDALINALKAAGTVISTIVMIVG